MFFLTVLGLTTLLLGCAGSVDTKPKWDITEEHLDELTSRFETLRSQLDNIINEHRDSEDLAKTFSRRIGQKEGKFAVVHVCKTDRVGFPWENTSH